MTVIGQNQRPTTAGNDWDNLQALQRRVSVILEHLQLSQARQADLEAEQQELEIQILGTKQRIERFPEFYSEVGRDQLIQNQTQQWMQRLKTVERQLLEEHSQQQIWQARYQVAARQFHRLTGYSHQSDRFLNQLPESFEQDYVNPRKLKQKPESMLLTITRGLSGGLLLLAVLAMLAGASSLAVLLGSGLAGLWGIVAVKESI